MNIAPVSCVGGFFSSDFILDVSTTTKIWCRKLTIFTNGNIKMQYFETLNITFIYMCSFNPMLKATEVMNVRGMVVQTGL